MQLIEYGLFTEEDCSETWTPHMINCLELRLRVVTGCLPLWIQR